MAIYVDKFGIPSKTETGFVSCHWTPCMSLSEKYTVEQWQTRAVEDELEKKVAELEAENAELKKAQDCKNGVWLRENTWTPSIDIYVYRSGTPATIDMQGWIPVSVPPKEGKKYWALDNVGNVLKAVYRGGTFYKPNHEDWDYINITNYMPRKSKPKPPK